MRRGDPNPKCPDCKGKGYTYFTDVCGCPPVGMEDAQAESVASEVERFIAADHHRRGGTV